MDQNENGGGIYGMDVAKVNIIMLVMRPWYRGNCERKKEVFEGTYLYGGGG